MPDLVTESLTTLTDTELKVISANAKREAVRISDSEPGYSLVWKALSLSADQARLSKRHG